MKQFLSTVHESKSKLGFAHGTLTIIGSILLSYLTMMVFSKYMVGDYAVKIIPSIILTPVMISIYALWLLYSKSFLICLEKVFILSFLLLFIIEVI